MNDLVPRTDPAALALSSLSSAPGPVDRWPFQTLRRMQRDPLSLFLDVAQQYGDLVQLALVQKVHLVNHPDHVKRLLVDNHLNYEKGFGYHRLGPLLGNGLLTSEGDFWKRQRRLAQPAFHRQRLGAFADLMNRHVQQLLSRWETLEATDRPINVHSEMMKLTLGIVAEALFSAELSTPMEEIAQAAEEVIEILNDHTMSAVVPPAWVPTPMNLRLRKALKVLNGEVANIITSRRASGVDHPDLLGMFMGVRDADTGETMNDQQLRDEVMTMLMAGHETTANALTFAFYLLSLHPEAAGRAQAELQSALGGRSPGLSDIPKLSYLHRVTEETMRLYPPAWFLGRKAIKDDVLGGFRIAAGSTVIMVPFISHRDRRFWENPEAFEPDRFTPERAALRPRFAYYPFAAGPRMCIGNAFAMMESQFILAGVLQRYQLELPAGHRLELDPQVTLRPRGGMPMRISRRVASVDTRSQPQVAA